MLSQTHSFQSDAELLAFQRRVLNFLARIETTDPAGNECLFLTNNKTVRRRLVTIQATSRSVLEEFNAYLGSAQADATEDFAEAY